MYTSANSLYYAIDSPHPLGSDLILPYVVLDTHAQGVLLELRFSLAHISGTNKESPEKYKSDTSQCTYRPFH